jgi:hypothetical protein
MGAELDARIRSALTELGRVRLSSSTAPDLAAVQLALDCVEETEKCLRAVAAKIGTDWLVAPSLERGNGELTLTLLSFDARGEGMLTRAVHWQSGSKLTNETFAAIPELVRGLFPGSGAEQPLVISAEDTLAPPPPSAAASGSAAHEATDSRPLQKLPIVPLAVTGGGAALLAAGFVTGLVMRNTERDYQKLDVNTRADAEQAAHTRSRARTEATLANVFLGVGLAVTAAGGTWLALTLLRGRGPEREASARLVPVVAPNQVGLVLQGGLP